MFRCVEALVETPSYFREKAKQCRRLAAGVTDQKDPIAVGLLALAEEFESKAVSQPAQPSSATRRSSSP